MGFGQNQLIDLDTSDLTHFSSSGILELQGLQICWQIIIYISIGAGKNNIKSGFVRPDMLGYQAQWRMIIFFFPASIEV